MKEKIPVLKPEKIIRVLERNGFERQKKSSGHADFKHPDGRWAKVPVHGMFDVGKGLLRRILKTSKKSISEFK